MCGVTGVCETNWCGVSERYMVYVRVGVYVRDVCGVCEACVVCLWYFNVRYMYVYWKICRYVCFFQTQLYCETDVTAVCNNGGTCQEDNPGWSCACAPAYNGMFTHNPNISKFIRCVIIPFFSTECGTVYPALYKLTISIFKNVIVELRSATLILVRDASQQISAKGL